MKEKIMKLFSGKRAVMVLLAVAAVMLLPLAASADMVYFYKITNNGNVNVASQLAVDVTDAGTTMAGVNQVLFTFTNNVGTPSSITDVYFADGTLLGIASITGTPSSGVAFASPATPGDLPGGNTVGFSTTQDFSADSETPIMEKGVNAKTETLGILFDLLGTKTFADTMLALSGAPGEAGSLSIGLHVQAIGTTGGSDSYVNLPPGTAPVPVPPTVWLMGSGMVGLALLGWRRRKQ
jgi:hypothetical protein